MPQVVLVYQPHQNLRQHSKAIQAGYSQCFAQADIIYWLPTFLSREDPNLPILEPKDLVKLSQDQSKIQISQMNQQLATILQEHKNSGNLVLFMGAGSIDEWAKEIFDQSKA